MHLSPGPRIVDKMVKSCLTIIVPTTTSDMPAIALYAGKCYSNLKALPFSPSVLNCLITLLLRLGYYFLLRFSSPSLQSAPLGGVAFATELFNK